MSYPLLICCTGTDGGRTPAAYGLILHWYYRYYTVLIVMSMSSLIKQFSSRKRERLVWILWSTNRYKKKKK